MLDKTTINELKKIIFKYLDQNKYRVFIFGSRAANNNRKFSDIDIGITSDKPVATEIINNIKEDLEESDIVYTVDVVDFSLTDKKFREVAEKKAVFLN